MHKQGESEIEQLGLEPGPYVVMLALQMEDYPVEQYSDPKKELLTPKFRTSVLVKTKTTNCESLRIISGWATCGATLGLLT